MVERVSVHGLQVARELHDFIVQKALPGSGVDAEKFWSGFAALATSQMPTNRALLATRDRLQSAPWTWWITPPSCARSAI